MNTENSHPKLLWSIFTNKCPHCRKGKLFINSNPYRYKTTMQMPECCTECGQKFELQTGFYFGTGFVSYGLTVLFSAILIAIWWLTIGLSVKDNRVWWCLGLNSALLILLQLPIQRLARSIWISFFVKYELKK